MRVGKTFFPFSLLAKHSNRKELTTKKSRPTNLARIKSFCYLYWQSYGAYTQCRAVCHNRKYNQCDKIPKRLQCYNRNNQQGISILFDGCSPAYTHAWSCRQLYILNGNKTKTISKEIDNHCVFNSYSYLLVFVAGRAKISKILPLYQPQTLYENI